MKIKINNNSVTLDKDTTIEKLLSKGILRMEKFDCLVKVNNKKVSFKNYSNKLYDEDDVSIKIKKRKDINLGLVKRIISFFQRVVKIVRRYNLAIAKVSFYEAIKPCFPLKILGGGSFYAPNKTTLGRFQSMPTNEPDTIEWIDGFNKTDVLLDIGANVGTFTIYAGHLGNKVISVEPLWSNYATLCENIILNNLTENITPLNLALSDRNGIEELVISSTESGASHNSIDVDVIQSQFIKDNPFLNVMGCKIDFVFKEFNLPIPNHIKIDVDGVEERVLFGAKNLLKSGEVRSILVEVSLMEDNQCDGIINFLSDLDYSLKSVAGVEMNFIDIRKSTNLRGFGITGTLNLVFYKNN
jgi:FkbM family methyltransferase